MQSFVIVKSRKVEIINAEKGQRNHIY